MRAEDLGELLPGRKRVGMVMKLLKSRNKFLWVFSHCIFFCSSLFNPFCSVYFFCSLFSVCCFSSFENRIAEFSRDGTICFSVDNFLVGRRWIPSVHKTMGGFSHFYAVLRIKRSAMDTIFNYCKCSWEASIHLHIFQPNVYQYGDGVKEKGAKNDRHARTSLYNQKEES